MHHDTRPPTFSAPIMPPRFKKRSVSVSSPKTETQPFRFLDLSAELRNRIYEYAYTGEAGEIAIDIDTTSTYKYGDYSHTKKATKEPFALMYTCKQIWNESNLLPYELNRVVFLVRKEPRIWRLAIRLETSSISLKRITLDCGITETNQYPVPEFQALRKIHKTGIDMCISFTLAANSSPCTIHLTDPASVASQMSTCSNNAVHALSESTRNRILRGFWPVWAVRNGYNAV